MFRFGGNYLINRMNTNELIDVNINELMGVNVMIVGVMDLISVRTTSVLAICVIATSLMGTECYCYGFE